MGTPHKHAAVIKAWADGDKIQWKHPQATVWNDYPEECSPNWSPSVDYRVKKEPRIITTYLYSENDGKSFFSSVSVAPQNGHYPGFPKAKHVATYAYEVPENDE